jgi:circadian clock protein KaiC
MNAVLPRVSTGVAGLDAMLSGGFLPGDSTLVAGSPGTGKTTLGLQFLVAGIAAGERGVFVTFEYLPQQLYRDAAKRGWPLEQWEREGKLKVLCTRPEILLASNQDGLSLLDEAIKEIGASRLVFDSVTHFETERGQNRLAALRDRLSGLMNHLRLLNVTAIVTHEISQIVGPAVTISSFGLEFFVDNVIVLRYVELEGELRKAVYVLKFRGGDHDRKFRSVRLTERGMIVESDFQGVENISAGTARRSLEQRVRQIV